MTLIVAERARRACPAHGDRPQYGALGRFWPSVCTCDDFARELQAYGDERAEEEREQIAKAVDALRDGYTVNVLDGMLIKDPDGPWFLKSEVAAAIRARRS
jgi:hypothetical protein